MLAESVIKGRTTPMLLAVGCLGVIVIVLGIVLGGIAALLLVVLGLLAELRAALARE